MSNTPTAEEFLRALPPVLRNDRRMIALGQVVAEELSDRMSEIEKAAIYPRIDELDEALLDILAYDFKVDWYGYDYPLETKRALLKSSFYIHRHLGTKGAVEAAIQSVYPKSIVEEWFDYVEGGNPYTFRIVLDASTPAVPVNNTDLLRAVNLYKSLRSHLDGIMFRSTHRFEIRTGCGWCVYTARPVRHLSGAGQGGSNLQFPCGGGDRARRRGVHHAADRPADCRHIPGSCRAGRYRRGKCFRCHSRRWTDLYKPHDGLCHGGYTPRCGSAGVYP